MTRQQKERYALLTDMLHWAVWDQYCLGGCSEDEFRLALTVMLREMADNIVIKIDKFTVCPSKR